MAMESPNETQLAWFLPLLLELMGLGRRVGGGDDDSDDEEEEEDEVEEEEEEEEEDEDVILTLRCVCWLDSSISRKVHWMFCPRSSLSFPLTFSLPRSAVTQLDGWKDGSPGS